MTEKTKLKIFSLQRFLLGGLLSALIAEVGLILLLYNDRFFTGNPLFFVFLGLGLPILIYNFSSRAIEILVVAVFWFFIGGVIAHRVRRNILAVGLWMLLYAILSAISIARFAEMMN